MASCLKFLVLIIFFISSTPFALAQCEAESKNGCHDKAGSMKLKIIAIVTILLSSMIGVCLPLFSRLVPALRPDSGLFTVVKAFSSGVILATGYMHVLPDSFDDLRSDCLPETPWRKFPFTTFVAMLSAVVTLMVDSFAMSMYKKRCAGAVAVEDANINGIGERLENGDIQRVNFGHGHDHVFQKNDMESQSTLRHRVIAQVYRNINSRQPNFTTMFLPFPCA